MKNATLTPEERKERKRAYDKAYRERKKAEAAAKLASSTQVPTDAVEEIVEGIDKAAKKGKAKAKKKSKGLQIEKRRKSLAVDIYAKTQPIRDCVTQIALEGTPSPDELAHVQSELRRLSRLVKKARKA